MTRSSFAAQHPSRRAEPVTADSLIHRMIMHFHTSEATLIDELYAVTDVKDNMDPQSDAALPHQIKEELLRSALHSLAQSLYTERKSGDAGYLVEDNIATTERTIRLLMRSKAIAEGRSIAADDDALHEHAHAAARRIFTAMKAQLDLEMPAVSAPSPKRP